MEVKLCDITYGTDMYAYRKAINEAGLENVLHIKLGVGGDRYGYKDIVYDSADTDIVESNRSVLQTMVEKYRAEYRMEYVENQ